jgi:hypothetical protein
MPEWICRICGNVLLDSPRAPSYCARCGLGEFSRLDTTEVTTPTEASPRRAPMAIAAAAMAPPPPPREARVAPTAAPKARPRNPTAARRVRPQEPLEVRFARSAPLAPLNISATGLLVEYVRPFSPGSICEVEIWRSELGLRLKAEVVRSVVSGGAKGSGGVRYQTAVRFLETPRAIYTLVPELGEEAGGSETRAA